ncbi:MAG: dihydroorotate dehydrogenase electron transfer subunit [Candidatus Acidiferrales bacterium]
MSDETVVVTENRPLTGGHFLLSLHSPQQAQATRAGQFAMLRLPGHPDALLRRPMSIYDLKPAPLSASGNGNQSGNGDAPAIVQLLYKVVGRGTELMAELKPGDKVEMLAPLGHGFFEEDYLGAARDADEVLHVAGGIGIAALLLPAKSLAKMGVRQKLFFGGRTSLDLVGAEDFAPYVSGAMLATEDGSCGHAGYVTHPLAEYLEKNHDRRFLLLVCGPWAMLQACVELATRLGSRCLVSMENRMGCGLGVCLGCCIRVEGEGHGSYERVCTEGPVFWSERVIWERECVPKI